jgi:DNA-binding NtrC family response regulator
LSKALKTVLIVDDEAFVRQSFVDFFEDRLWRSLQVESAELALKLLDEESPQGAVVDIRLKGMDGETFIRKAFQKQPQMTFLICTGSPEYRLPDDLSKLPNICSRLFRKPVSNMAEIESNLLGLISNIERMKDSNERQ